MESSNIETGVGAMLSAVCREVADCAGLAILRGSVGIGKSFALERIVAELEEDGVRVVFLTATETVAGQINAFLRVILTQYYTDTASSAEAEEAVWTLLSGRPFTPTGDKVVLIVDEAQKLGGRVLETIRGLYDRGDAARLGNKNAPAFGCVMVGNPTFMSKGGAQRLASFEPLVSRLTHNVRLPGPNRAECTDFAKSLLQDEALVAELAEFGVSKGTLRSMAIAARRAEQMAGSDPVAVAHLRHAVKMMGGR
ncbi:ATP-binding protein [Marivita sp. S6314]|uniref:AAA family ATPase n=1 Tax=Marivita sp. S6314 TaxID=2926406 RepID=UPI001FF4A6C1|nr:AAA family ATPase [Marivita sp. S6314]MCK0150430.1 ATP-binding protein [Marivita sp. S6314]